MLVAYFSHSGNTREVARQISEATGGDLFEIVPATPYPTEYRAVVDQGKKEIEAGVRPALKNPVGDLSQYDVIFVGSPCWWATIAPPVATFLSSCDLAGKTVVPFMTHEGSRMGRSEEDIRRRAADAAANEVGYAYGAGSLTVKLFSDCTGNYAEVTLPGSYEYTLSLIHI